MLIIEDPSQTDGEMARQVGLTREALTRRRHRRLGPTLAAEGE